MNARVVAALVAAGAVVSLALAACSPSLEEDSSQPPGSDPELSIAAPSSAAPAHEDAECAVDDIKVEGESGRQPKLVLPKDCAAPAEPLSKTLDQGEGAAVKKGNTVLVNYLIRSLDSSTVAKSWASATDGQAEQVVVGGGTVMPGWDEALVGMKAGERKLLVLPPEQGAAEADEKLGFAPDETLVLVIGLTQITA